MYVCDAWLGQKPGSLKCEWDVPPLMQREICVTGSLSVSEWKYGGDLLSMDTLCSFTAPYLPGRKAI